MTFRFLIAEGFASIRRVLAASIIGSLLTGIALAIVGGLILVALAYRAELGRARSSASVEVFLADNVDSVEAASIAASIRSFPDVGSARVRSRQESADLFDIQPSADTALFPEGLPLPITIRVELQEEAQNMAGMTRASEKFRTIAGVEDVSIPDELVRTVEERSRIFLRIALAIGIVLSASVIGVVANTAQLTVVSRRSVIRTMRLMGAERRWVVAPFIIQGLLIGLIGGTVATGLIYGSWYFFPELGEMLHGRELEMFPLLFPLVGMILGMTGAASASGYYVARQR